jgi:hypothetical protein
LKLSSMNCLGLARERTEEPALDVHGIRLHTANGHAHSPQPRYHGVAASTRVSEQHEGGLNRPLAEAPVVVGETDRCPLGMLDRRWNVDPRRWEEATEPEAWVRVGLGHCSRN